MITIDDALRDLLDQEIQKLSAPGLPVPVGGTVGWYALGSDGSYRSGIVYSGQVEYQQGSGSPVTPDDDTLWEIGSTTKSFTAALVMLYAVANPGFLTQRIYGDLKSWIQATGKPPADLTAASYDQLLSMVAGWSKWVSASAVQTVLDDLMQASTYDQTPLVFQYSNLAFAMLGYGMTRHLGSPPKDASHLPEAYWDMLATQLLSPLGMTAYLYGNAPEQQLPWASDDEGGTYRKTDGHNGSWPGAIPAGALTMSAPNLGKWLTANMVPGVIPTAALQGMRSPQIPCKWGEGQWMGRGWFIADFFAGGSMFHMINKNGAVPGCKAGVGYLQPAPGEVASTAGVFSAFNCSGANPAIFNQVLLAKVMSDPNLAIAGS